MYRLHIIDMGKYIFIWTPKIQIFLNTSHIIRLFIHSDYPTSKLLTLGKAKKMFFLLLFAHLIVTLRLYLEITNARKSKKNDFFFCFSLT